MFHPTLDNKVNSELTQPPEVSFTGVGYVE